MLGSTRNIRVFAMASPCDLRKGFDGLYALARDLLKQDPLSGHAFLFVSRNRKRAKVLHYDGTGLCIYAKRLEQGCFVALWERTDADGVHLTLSELALFLEGSTAVRKKLSPKPFLP